MIVTFDFDSERKVYANTIEYRNEKGNLHREDGPAVITKLGSEQWWYDGRIHRADGPAVIWGSGEAGYSYGKLPSEEHI
jgi:hypothetical protein